MAADRELVALMNQPCFVSRPVAMDENGEPIYGQPHLFMARVQPKTRYIAQADGSETATSIDVITLESISTRDRIYLPGVSIDSADGAREPASVNAMYDELGDVSHYEVMI